MRIRNQISLADRLSQVDYDLAKVISYSGHLDGEKSDDVVSVKPATMKSSDLGPSQTTMRLDDVLGNALEMLYTGASNPVKVGAIVSADNRIMDGHHRWAASIIAFGKQAGVKAWKSDLVGSELVKVLNLLSKGKFKVTKGNKGSASINDLTPGKVRKRLLEYLQGGRDNKYFSFSPEEFKVMLEDNFGDVETGIEIMSERANLINKSVPGWAPQRSDMPVIDENQIPEVSRSLGNGEVDWKAPFSDETTGLVMASSNRPSSKRVVSAFVEKNRGMSRTAGEVRFIKDHAGDKENWAFGMPGASDRHITNDFEFNLKESKPLAITLRSALMALGHAHSAATTFVKIKSRNISPDGNLGGKGYVQKITDIRRSFMNCVEALSAVTDTLYDEIKAPHWQPGPGVGNREREEVREILEDAEEIREDPEEWAEQQSEEMDEDIEEETSDKTSSTKKVASMFLQATRNGKAEG